MIVKRAPAPSNGGSARGNVRYILGYSLSEKRELWEEKNASYHTLMDEAQLRPDRGVGVVWSPAVGNGVRPSSVYATGVMSLATADLEMQANALGNPRVKSATSHEIFSFGADPDITDEAALEAVRRVYLRAGLGGAQYVAAVHRDSDHVHVHVARATISPLNLRAFDTQMIDTRLHRAARHVELQMGLAHDRGLAVVDTDAAGVPLVRDSTRAERIAWGRENVEERLAMLERVRYADNEKREGSFARWADARVEPRLREVLRSAKEAGEAAQPIDLLNKAARHGCRIQVQGAGEHATALLRDVSVERLRETHREQLAEAAKQLEDRHANGLLRDETLTALRASHAEELVAEMRRLEREGDVVQLSPRMHTELVTALERTGGIAALASTEPAQDAFREAVEADPGYVVRALTQQSSTFTRDDVDRYLVDRFDDLGDVEELSHKIFTDVGSLVLLSPDIADGVWTTTEMLRIEEQIARDVREIAQRPDLEFDATLRNRIIGEIEAERSAASGKAFRFSAEQRTALARTGHLSVLQGRPGVGKTLLMEVLRREAEAQGRKIAGITIAQAAAERLQVTAGFATVNSAFALVADNPKRELLPRNGTLVLDEAAMLDSRTMQRIVALAHERNTKVVAIGDPRQIQAVGAGGPFHILADAARETGTFAELNEIRRQKNAWHVDAVHLVSDAIEQKSERLFDRAAALLARNGALAFVPNKDDAIAGVVEWYRRQQAISPDVLLVATDRDTVRYLNEELLRQRAYRPAERTYLTDGGQRGLAIGDRWIAGENNTTIGVVNGDVGTVVQTESIIVGVRLDRTSGIVKFDSRRYDRWDHGYATTVARAQGASVRALGGIVDSAATAEVFHVLTSRSERELLALIPETAFKDAKALAEHLTEHIVAKGTTQDISPLVASHGGPDSFYARNVAAQRISAANPARQAYEAEWTTMRVARERELQATSEAFRKRRHGVDDPAVLKSLRSEQRRAEAAIIKSYEPEDFGAWNVRHAQRAAAADTKVGALKERRVHLPGIDLSPDLAGVRIEL